MLHFIFGSICGTILFQFFIINFIYMSNPGLFNDIILTKKSSYKLYQFYKELDEFKNADKEIWGDDNDY